VSCYFRHIENILHEAGISVSPGNRKQIDQAIHQIEGSAYKDCPGTWKGLKQQIVGDEQRRQDFIKKLRDALQPDPSHKASL
jgi:hypothetical protein